jgi:hypothetical protein
MKTNDATHAWKTLLASLLPLSWKVIPRAGGEAIYTTPSGRVGTLTLRPYDEQLGLWRWTVDYYSVRYPRTLRMAEPRRPEGRPCSNELTCHRSELAPLALWLPAWLKAYDEPSEPLPAAPVRLVGAKIWQGGYAWTGKGSRVYAGRPGKKAKKSNDIAAMTDPVTDR